MNEDPATLDVVSLYRGILSEYGLTLSQDWTILDYGCGSGRHTYQFIDSGYSRSFGYDVADYARLRSSDDRDRFRINPTLPPHDSPPTTKVPWPDGTFDFVHATSVFEHVADQAVAYGEIARVLKPGGIFLNIFPARWRPIEPHMYVPFGGVITARAWFLAWSCLGIRNQFQKGMSAADVADSNHAYAHNGINYLSGAEIDRIIKESFAAYQYVEQAFVNNCMGRSRHLASAFKAIPLLKSLFRACHTRVILARK